MAAAKEMKPRAVPQGICSSGQGGDTDEMVWVGFLDSLPVIGSVKEAVEWVLALGEGDPMLAAEKQEKMMVALGLQKETSGRSSGRSSGFSSADEGDAGAAMAGTDAAVHGTGKRERGREGVPLISLTSYIENMASKGKKGSVSQEAGQQQKKMIEIKNMIQEAFRRIDPDYQIGKQVLKDTGVRSERGEHVINNDVLKFHIKIEQKFLTERRVQRDVECPLDEIIQNDIMYEMVAEFEPYELYINVNAVIYGFYCGVLRITLLMLLEPTSQMNSNPLPAVQNWRIQMLRRTEEVNWRDEADRIITNMNACQAYVDPFAKVKWTGNSSAKLRKFEAARESVAVMYQDIRGPGYFGKLSVSV
ncbi:uncharacterized protein LOC114773115 [Denticeps clupeoides]|uniref:uncharacterized protein LOC114773115 n=1 Tax=Denticeps clupeoides TaxID=299321 RepID=UPI0010A36EC1|nr:uncharacterized protein LOC114773115 [Denticeps clupeoides]XP_028821471.1 uncharacterized protein LOC114773115 [Denticeps clupeoides]XP_028821472.1 uncharacterized protein LOC114773115 [Denticeps clupeoides]